MLIKLKKRIYSIFINFRYAFRINKPFLLLRLIKNFLFIFLLRKVPLRYVDVAVGYRCNLRCEHCFAVDLIEENRHIISPNEYSRVAREAMKLGAVTFSFQGGEPLLYPELQDYIKAANPWANLISVTTNGTLLTNENLERLKRWGVDILTVSLDSGIPAEHDRFRGKEGSFLEVYNGIKRALAFGINVTIGTVITFQNLRSDGIKRLIGISRELKVVLILILGIPLGRWRDREDILLTKSDLEYLEALILKHPYVRTDFYANYFNQGCGAVKEILYLNPYGDVFACPFLHQKLGNVFSEPLYAIRERALKKELFKNYNNICIATLQENFHE